MAARAHVLVVEDDAKTAQWLELYLTREGLDVSVASDGAEALRMIDSNPPDLVMLDVMLPGANGFDVCRAIRGASAVPVIFITARAGEDDRLRGFALGADDYVTKPFSPREVVARVKAVLRRVGDAETVTPDLTLAGIVLRVGALTVSSGGVLVKLTPAEARLLAAFMSAPGRVWSRAQLVARALGDDFDGTERTVDVHIKNLRRKLEQLPPVLRVVTTHGAGYHLETM
jgi:two-component system OmpR family response regulator